MVRGITSACAEQTVYIVNDVMAEWDHLRVCGADYAAAVEEPPV